MHGSGFSYTPCLPVPSPMHECNTPGFGRQRYISAQTELRVFKFFDSVIPSRLAFSFIIQHHRHHHHQLIYDIIDVKRVQQQKLVDIHQYHQHQSISYALLFVIWPVTNPLEIDSLFSIIRLFHSHENITSQQLWHTPAAAPSTTPASPMPTAHTPPMILTSSSTHTGRTPNATHSAHDHSPRMHPKPRGPAVSHSATQPPATPPSPQRNSPGRSKYPALAHHSQFHPAQLPHQTTAATSHPSSRPSPGHHSTSVPPPTPREAAAGRHPPAGRRVHLIHSQPAPA